MRIPIREQLGLLVLLTSSFALAVISIVTWLNNYNFVLDIRSSALTLTASLKAAQISSTLLLIQSSVKSTATRILIQTALKRYYDGNNTAANWVNVSLDLQASFAGSSILLQAIVYARSPDGPSGPYGLVNSTTLNPDGEITLPYKYSNQTNVDFGDDGLGYPPPLYPALTYHTNPDNTTSVTALNGTFPINNNSSLLTGPFHINETVALLSLTVPINNNTLPLEIIGYMTVVVNAQQILNVLNSVEGLDQSGIMMLLGPADPSNHFSITLDSQDTQHLPNSNISTDTNIQYLFSPSQNSSRSLRHPLHAYGSANSPFPMKNYQAVVSAYTSDNHVRNNAGSSISIKNDEGFDVSVGYAIPVSPVCDWVLLMEEDRSEAYAPIVRLRNILLACIFGTLGLILLLLAPIAHFSVRPIRRLREATKGSIDPPGYASDDTSPSGANGNVPAYSASTGSNASHKQKEGFFFKLAHWQPKRKGSSEKGVETQRRHTFRIPGKVQDRKHYVHDELTDLTQTFNEMTEELLMQYERLEERVKERTEELELSKKAAEAANESKTLFIANISHELKTPLNGILGMCAVCMQEDDPTKIRRSLGIIYKSGDLLLHLLTDLLTFTKNQIGQQITLEEREFRLSDISSQILHIFELQAKEGSINLKISFLGPLDLASGSDAAPESLGYGPIGTGRLKDMSLWGDYHRILQVIINLVSNSLKFTPPDGSVHIRIKCLGEAEVEKDDSRKGSILSRHTSSRTSKLRNRIGSGSNSCVVHPNSDISKKPGTALSINPMDPSKGLAHPFGTDGPPSPPPQATKILSFAFEVEDTGPGIPEHLKGRVFEPFVQGDLGLSKKFGGTGLGLSICSQLATLMRGSISLESKVGVGSTFVMTIPLKFVKEKASSIASSNPNQAPSQRNSLNITARGDLSGPLVNGTPETPTAKTPPDMANGTTLDKAGKPRLVGLKKPYFTTTSASSSPPSQISAMEIVAAEAARKEGDKVRVLVAEDNLVNQEVVLRMLKLEEIYDVTLAKDGQEALDKVKESMEGGRLFDLIFMDIQMPNLDGLQSTRLIRQMGYSAPIVALTAFTEESNVKECLDSGMNYFLSKPIRRPALKQVLKAYCPTIPEEIEQASSNKHSPTSSENPVEVTP
ncbi:MAG: Histidine kinase [Trizodia sp. TS-e1964]|nr:MAG: Histidine kinase [Trizodia sp. TS-e1964]